MSENISKIWGERRRLLLTNKTEIDLLYLKKNSFCSTHSHVNKINMFVVVSGRVRIETEFGNLTLTKNNSWEVHPMLKHRFFALEDSVMIELAYVNKGRIQPMDINRISQGGRVIDGKEMTADAMREKGLLDL